MNDTNYVVVKAVLELGYFFLPLCTVTDNCILSLHNDSGSQVAILTH